MCCFLCAVPAAERGQDASPADGCVFFCPVCTGYPPLPAAVCGEAAVSCRFRSAGSGSFCRSVSDCCAGIAPAAVCLRLFVEKDEISYVVLYDGRLDAVGFVGDGRFDVAFQFERGDVALPVAGLSGKTVGQGAGKVYRI